MASRMRRAATRARSIGRRGRSFGGGRSKPFIDGALGAVVSRAAGNVSSSYGPGAGLVAVGVYRKNDALTTLGTLSLAGAAIDGAGIPMLSGKLGSAGVL